MTNPAEATTLEYDPNRFVDWLRTRLGATSDAMLCRMLDVAPPVISHIRSRRMVVGANLLISIHELTGLKISEIRALLGDRRKKFRTGKEYFQATDGRERSPRKTKQEIATPAPMRIIAIE